MLKKFIILLTFIGLSLLAVNLYAEEGVEYPSAVYSSATITKTVSPSYSFVGYNHVINGVALRNRLSGVIPLRGVPVGSTVERALLYWNYSDKEATGAATSPILFNGNYIDGTKVADNADPCWGMTGNHTYRANVTKFVPSTRPNEDYEVSVMLTGSTTGQNPWSPIETQDIRMDGASLIVVYSGSTTAGDKVFIYDKLSGTEFSFDGATFTLTHPTYEGSGLFSMSGADGQLGPAPETTIFNQVQIAGPPVGDSDWNGSCGIPLPQLYDVHTHTVSNITGTSSVVDYTTPNDCLVPTAFVIQQGL